MNTERTRVYRLLYKRYINSSGDDKREIWAAMRELWDEMTTAEQESVSRS